MKPFRSNCFPDLLSLIHDGRVYHAAVAALRIAIIGLLALGALALPTAAAVAPGSGVAHPSIGFEPVPLSIVTDATGHVYLSNPQRSDQIQQYSADGTLLASWGNFARSGSALKPRDLATDAAGDLYVADSSRGLLSVLGPDGAALRPWKADARDLALGAGGVVYVVGSSEVQRFSPDGALLSKWGASGNGDGQFGSPYGIDTSPSGLVYVADTYASRHRQRPDPEVHGERRVPRLLGWSRPRARALLHAHLRRHRPGRVRLRRRRGRGLSRLRRRPGAEIHRQWR